MGHTLQGIQIGISVISHGGSKEVMMFMYIHLIENLAAWCQQLSFNAYS